MQHKRPVIAMTVLRLQQRLTMQSLAVQLGLSPTTLSRIENGHFRPSVQTAAALQSYFKRPSAVLLSAVEI